MKNYLGLVNIQTEAIALGYLGSISHLLVYILKETIHFSNLHVYVAKHIYSMISISDQ